jgi:hypothetical protein
MWISHVSGSASTMVVEAIVMLVMMEVPVMMPAHSGMGIQHARLHMKALDARRMRCPAMAGGHCGRGNKHGSCKQRGGNRLKHGRLL